MSKIIAISYSFLILFQSLNISSENISRISTLLEHAEYHQDTYGDSFIEFLTEHYGETMIAHENEHEEHEDLPFKQSHQTCAHTSIAFTFEKISFDLNCEAFVEIPFNFFYKESHSTFEKHSVFQPPKFI